MNIVILRQDVLYHEIIEEKHIIHIYICIAWKKDLGIWSGSIDTKDPWD